MFKSSRIVYLVFVSLFAWGLLACPPSQRGGRGGDADDNDDASDDDDFSNDDDSGDDDDSGWSDCPSDEIEDCNGNCGPLDWWGDGICDDMEYEWPEGSGIFIDFNCSALEFDLGDCNGGDDDDSAVR